MELGKILDRTPEPSLLPAQVDSLVKTKNTCGDYSLPVPMTESQKFLTNQVVSLHYSDILKFFETTESVMPESLDTLVVNSELVASHPYLLVDQHEPHNLLLKEVPSQLARESGKFAILGDIIDIIKDWKVNVALVARAGKSLDLIEAYILGKFVNYRRYSGSYLREPTGEEKDLSTIHLIPSHSIDPEHIGSEKFSFILAFDTTFSPSIDYIQKVSASNPPHKVPVLRLVSPNSIEHITLKFGHYIGNEFLKRVVAALVILRHSIGSFPVELRPIYQQRLIPIAAWFENPSTLPWPLPELKMVEEFSASDVEESLLKEESEDEAEDDNDKTARVSSYYNAKRIKRETDYAQATTDEPLIVQDRLTHNLVKRLTKLIEDNAQLKADVENYRSTSSNRQEAFEQLTEEMGTKIRLIAELENRVKFAERKAERLSAERDRAMEKTELISTQLEEANNTIKAGPPEVAKFDEQRKRIEEMEEELKKANDKVAARSTENEYMREEYQKASSAAADAHAQIKLLKEENLELEKRADGEAIRLRALTFDEERSLKDDQIKEYKVKIELLEEHLKRMMSSEKQQQGRSRLASRANSSSKMSRTNSPIIASDK